MTLNGLTEHLELLTTTHTTRSSSGRGRGRGSKLELTGIKKLRELILDLAVRGKLVPQSPEDEPASVLLKRIAAEKVRLVKEKKIKKQKPLPEITIEEKSFELPAGWEWVHIGNVAEVKGGKRLPKGHTLQSEPTDHIYIRVTDMKNGTVTNTNLQYLLPSTQKLISQYVISSNDLYVTIAGTIGEIGSVPTEFNGMNLTENAAKIIFEHIDRLWFKQVLSSGFVQTQFKKKVKQMAQPKLALHRILSSVIPLPPEAEQHRIVTKVNELMTLCDQLEQDETNSIAAHQALVDTMLTTLTDSKNAGELAENWSLVAQHFDTLFTTDHSIEQFKQTILQLVVMGRLVPQDASDEPASVLLERIATERARLVKEKKIKRQKPLPAIADEEKPFALPKGWEWCRIGNAALSSVYGLSEKTTKHSDGVPVLKMGDIQNGQVILGGQQVVDKLVDGLPELYLDDRDLLYNRTNSAELVGKTGIFIGQSSEYSFASYLIRIRTLKDSPLPEFLNMNMNSPVFRKTQIVPRLKQQCGQANVNGTIMGKMLVAIAPEAEQTRIQSKFQEVMQVCNTLKSQIHQTQTTQQQLSRALVEQALA